jgi:hypothetical protein
MELRVQNGLYTTVRHYYTIDNQQQEFSLFSAKLLLLQLC